ncbi:MAG: patatin-like phospholipase family protein [Acetobacteraceae bacterium]|nr:patatin-like phospholipase family protein [Acetobacteraceae bacterium]
MQRRDVWQALAEEFEAIRGSPVPGNRAGYTQAALSAMQSALCLSGGGIRSAAFALGVLQALARHRFLVTFDYLSTVSGGGFAGGWLSAVMKNARTAESAQDLLRAEPPRKQVRSLRDYTNYLTPRTGLLSLDTWAGIAIYARNVILNWLVFGPAFALAALATIFYRTLLWRVGQGAWSAALVWLGALVLMIGTARACLDLPSHRPPAPAPAPWLLRALPLRVRDWILARLAPAERPEAGTIEYAPAAGIGTFIGGAALIWALLTPMTLSNWYAKGIGSALMLPAVYAGALTLGYVLAMAWRRELGLYARNADAWLLATLVSAGLIWLGLRLGRLVPPADQAEALAVVGPLWLILAHVSQSTLHVGLRRSTKLGDLDREWLARLSALKLRPAVLWSVLAFFCLSVSRVVFQARAYWPFWAVALTTVLSGPGGAWLGKQAIAKVEALIAAPTRTDRSLATLLPLLAFVFAVGIAVLLGGVLAFVLGWLQIQGAARITGTVPRIPAPEEQDPLASWYAVLPLPLQVTLAVLLLTLLLSAARRINVNRFSMHGVYRNRLTRAFLGSARAERRPEPITGFDPDDNPRLTSLARPPPCPLFHVINTALNLTYSARLAWAERKAESFTMTALACGSAELAMPDQRSRDEEPRGVYVPTHTYAGNERETARPGEPTGVTLATPLTLSGAAVSPNWGYHSSPATAFLMTLFNVRLGAWLPNPAVIKTPNELQRSAPVNSLLPFFNELLGRTTERSRNIYLSDGGHFDNLGLYEMLRRRCRLILVIDAGQDPELKLTDLGNAIRKASIDLDVKVIMRPMRLASRIAIEKLSPNGRAAVLGYAIGRIRYPERRGGLLIYLKPSWLENIPADVRAYGALHPEFPHESTSDQWFTESQFESYRRLGEFQMQQLLQGLPEGNLLAMFRRTAYRLKLRSRMRYRAHHKAR